MSESKHSEKEESAPWFDGTSAGWAELHRQTEVFAWEGALIAPGLARADVSKWIASGYLGTRFAHRGPENESAFPDVVTFFPPQEGGDLWQETLSEILRLMREQQADELSLRIAPRLFECRSLVTLQAEDLLRQFSNVPEGSCCFVIGCDLYRSSELAAEHVEQKRIYLEDVVEAELQRLNERLLELATARRLTIVATYEYWRVRRCEFWSVFRERERFLGGVIAPAIGSIAPALVKKAQAAFDENGWAEVDAVAQEAGVPASVLGAKVVEWFINSEEPNCGALLAAHPGVRESLLPENLIAAAQLLSKHGVGGGERELLEAALAHARALPLEALSIGYHTAQGAALEDLAGRFRLRLLQRFPCHRVAQAINCNWLFRQRRFAESVPVAQLLGEPILIAEAEAFASETMRVEKFLEEAAKVNDREGALIECAQEALQRGGYRHAILWCREVSETHAAFYRAFVLRVEALSRALHRSSKGIYLSEFTELCRIAAQRPYQPAFREKLFWLIDHGIEEPSAKILLSATLLHAAQAQSVHDDTTISASRELNGELREKAKPLDGEKFHRALEQYLDSVLGREIHLGEGDLPELFANEMGAEAIKALCYALDDLEVKCEPLICRRSLHLLVLLCTRHGDPSADLSCLQSIAGWQVVTGDAQEARDLAETALQKWSQTQPRFVAWRTSLAWLISADVYHRSGNILSAALCAYLALLSLDGPGWNIECLFELYRLCARVQRDLDFMPGVLAVAAIERRILEQFPGNKTALHRHEVFLYQALSRAALRSATPAEVLELLHTGDALLNVGVETEKAPLLSMQANLIRRLGEAAVPAELLERFRENLASLPAPFRPFLGGAARTKVTRDELLTAIRALSAARFAEDLSFQVSPILPLACNAPAAACADNDPELFLLASSLLAQPAMAVSLAAKAEAEAADAFSFEPLLKITLAELQSCLRENETALILSGEPGRSLYRMLVTKTACSAPGIVPEDEWDATAFAIWRRTHFKRFDWEIPRDILDPIRRPPAKEVRDLMADLRLAIDPLPEELVIIPPTHLFGFTFNLARHGAGFLGEATRVSIAPSMFWLFHRRTHAWNGAPKRMAWIGSQHTKDMGLHVLRARVEHVLVAHNFAIDRSDQPRDFANSQMVMLGAHGGTGLFQYFRTVGDRVVQFAPTNLAVLLENAGCVVLAVCSGGRSDTQHGSEEALGLTAALLRAGVRCVIAPPWPLVIDVMDRWLPAFLHAVDAGATMSEAAKEGQIAIGQRFDHPLPKLQLHLYGDAAFRVV